MPHHFSGGENVVSVFKQDRIGVREPRFLAACHGVSADKAAVESEPRDRFVDGALDAADIGDDRLFGQEGFEFLQKSVINGDRSA